jgi:5-methylcytosine-specific restriction endonuclease McrA
LRNFPGTIRPYETDGLEVHHITKIEEDETKAFDEDNLISLCRVHHEMAEQGRVTAKDLVAIAKENNERYR